jgi:hypothetical protein
VKTRNSRVVLFLLLVALVLTGCVGGGSSNPEAEIRTVLRRLENLTLTKDLSAFNSMFAPIIWGENGQYLTREELKLALIAIFTEIEYLEYEIRNPQFLFNKDMTEAVVHVTEYAKVRHIPTRIVNSGTSESIYVFSKVSGKWVIEQARLVSIGSLNFE